VMDMNGVRTPLAEVVSSDKPIFVNFIFTTCTTICPVMTGVFAKLQDALGDERDDVRMLSFSIDPDYDTPARLRAYAELFGAESQWDFYTGRLEDIIRVEKAFDVYRGNKMNHEPTTLLRAGPDAPWVRIDGLASADDLLREYRKLTTAKASGH